MLTLPAIELPVDSPAGAGLSDGIERYCGHMSVLRRFAPRQRLLKIFPGPQVLEPKAGRRAAAASMRRLPLAFDKRRSLQRAAFWRRGDDLKIPLAQAAAVAFATKQVTMTALGAAGQSNPASSA